MEKNMEKNTGDTTGKNREFIPVVSSRSQSGSIRRISGGNDRVILPSVFFWY